MSFLEREDAATSRDAGITYVPHTLAISPDLDALLEHDERMRHDKNPPNVRSCHFFQSPKSSPFMPEFSGGLPPPPRGNRKIKSRPTTPKDLDSRGLRSRLPSDVAISPTSSAFSEVKAAMSNPYINEPPRITPDYLYGRSRSTSGVTSEFDLTNQSGSVENRRAPAPQSEEHDYHQDLAHSLLSQYDSQDGSQEDWSSARGSEPQDSPVFRTPTLPCVDKLIEKGKHLFSMSSSQVPGSDRDSPNIMRFGRKAPQPSDLPPLSDTRAIHIKPQLETLGEREVIGAVSSISSRSTSDSKKPERPRISHSPHSDPRRPRSESYSFDSKYSPTMSPETRFSLINTSPPSPSSVYRRRPSDPPLRSPATSTDNERRDSFIDLYTPSSLEFARPKRSPSTSRSVLPPPTLAIHDVEALSSSQHTSPTSHGSSSRSPLSATTLLSSFPMPQTGKTSFRRPQTAPGNKSRKGSHSPMSGLTRQNSPNTAQEERVPPPTTNYLKPQERADLVKKSRKLTQVFGTTPGGAVLHQYDDSQPRSFALSAATLPSNRHVRATMSVSGSLVFNNDAAFEASWDLPEGTQYVSASGRRHSAPFSPDAFSLSSRDLTRERASNGGLISEEGSQYASPFVQSPTHRDLDSPTSFIDLSDEDISNDGASMCSSKRGKKSQCLQHSISIKSLAESLLPEEQEETERKRKREQLTKLHRFLGSRVPVDLVLGLANAETPLPALAPLASDRRTAKLDKVFEDEDDEASKWPTRRRSSSAEAYPERVRDLDRLKEELDDEEKARNVRRAHKMEKVFGVLPPQTLYHTRSSPSPSNAVVSSNRSRNEPCSPVSQAPNYNQGFERNLNQSAYKTKAVKYHRSSASESVQHLLPTRTSASLDRTKLSRDSLGVNSVYSHYQYSLLSLNDILDRDDRASLVELHQYLQDGEDGEPAPQLDDVPERRESLSSSIKSERRRSLPSSIMSIATADYMPLPKSSAKDFQMRRRRAAKLTQFFGVDYNQIIRDVLDSIEKGVEEESKRGTLQPAETEVLLQKLRALKAKRVNT